MSASASKTRLAYAMLLKGGVLLRTIGDAMRYLDAVPDGTERNAIRLLLVQAHWYGLEVDTVTRRLFIFLDSEGLIFKHSRTGQPLPVR